jgi:hypothetical protein
MYAQKSDTSPREDEVEDEGVQERPIEIRVITELQDRYDALEAPGMIMLPITGTSAVPVELLLEIERELFRYLVNGGRVKPIIMHKWLNTTYSTRKANNPFSLINTIKAEQYVIPVQYMGKGYVFKSENSYILILNFYPLATYYPVTILRIFKSRNEVPVVLASCLDEMGIRLFKENADNTRKRIVIDKFRVELLKLVELGSGEFEYVTAPFIEQDGVPIRDDDDFFSGMFGYILSSTDLFQVIRPAEFSGYTNATNINTNYADYILQGRVQISDKESILYVDVQDIRTGKKIITIRNPLLEYSLRNIWNAYREIAYHIVTIIYESGSFGVVPALSATNRGFFCNDMFIGWETLENFVLRRGLHKIVTGTYYYAINGDKNKSSVIEIEGNNQKTTAFRTSGSRMVQSADVYYVLLDTISRIYTYSEGEHLWNLLNK